MNIYPFSLASNTIRYRETLNRCKMSFDACSLQPTNGAVGEYAGLLVIRKYQESIGQDLGMKSAHGTKPDSAVTSHTDMKIKSRQSQGVSLEKFMSAQEELRRTRQETEDVKEHKLKDLIIVHCYQFDNEMVAVKLFKSPDYCGWNCWQSIVIETEYGHAQVDEADENSQRLETYDAMRKTTESEREAEDQIMEQVNKYTRNGGLRYCRVFTWLSEIESVESKVETEMLSVKMRLTKAICRNQVKFGDDAEKLVSNEVKKTLAEATQLVENVSEQSSKSFLIYETLKMRKEVHQTKERREVLEKPPEYSKEDGKDDNDELRNIAAKFNRQDATLQLEQDTRSLESAQLESRAAEEAKDEEATKNELIIGQQAKHADVLKLQEIMTCGKLYPNNEANNEVYLVINGPFRGSSCGTGRATRRWLQP